MKFTKNIKLFGAVLALSCLLGFALYEWGGLGPPKVVAAKVTTGTLSPTVFGVGTVQAKISYTVGPTQTGRLLKVYADQGDMVKTGQVLGEIDPVDLEQRISASDAALAGSQHNTIAARAQIEDARSRNDLAQLTAVRYTKLFASGAVSKELLEAKQHDAEVAQAALAAAVASFQSSQSKVVQAAADYQGQLEQQKSLLLISPADGIVVTRQGKAGSTVAAGQSVFTIIDPQTLWVQTRIDQTRFSGIALGQTADIVLRSNQNETVKGIVARLEVQGDTVTEERFVDVKFAVTPTSVFLADLANVTIYLPEAANTLYIPATAVKTTNSQYGVWVIQSGRAQYRPVTTGVRTRDGNVQIISGLAQDETVIVNCKSPLTAGARVRLVTAL